VKNKKLIWEHYSSFWEANSRSASWKLPHLKWNSKVHYHEGACLLECDAVSLAEWFLTFWRFLTPSSSGSNTAYPDNEACSFLNIRNHLRQLAQWHSDTSQNVRNHLHSNTESHLKMSGIACTVTQNHISKCQELLAQ